MGNSDLLLMALLVVACWTDLLARRIPNALIVLGLCLGLGISNSVAGFDGAMQSLLGGLVGLLAFLPFFALRWMGAGDVKLLAMVGSFVGLPAIVIVALYAALAGAALGLGSQFLVRLGLAANSAVAREASPQPSIAPRIVARLWGRFSEASFQLPYAIAITIGWSAWLATRGA